MLLFKKTPPAVIRATVFSMLMLGSLFLLQACFPYGPTDIEEFDIVATFFDENANFAAYKTYAMPDTIARINPDGSVSTDVAIYDYDALILSQVAANMSAVGYTRVDNPEDADMTMTLAISKSGYNIGSSYDYGSYYGSGYGTSGSYAGGSGYDLQTGTVIMNLSTHAQDGGLTTKGIWLGLLNGITEQSYTNTSRRLIELINRCFAQSPYLGTSK